MTRGDRDERPLPDDAQLHGQPHGEPRPHAITRDLSPPQEQRAVRHDNLPLALIASLGLPFVQRAGSVWIYLLADGAPLTVKVSDHGDHIALTTAAPPSDGPSESEQNGVRITREKTQTLIWMLLGPDALNRGHLTGAVARLTSVAAPLVPTRDD